MNDELLRRPHLAAGVAEWCARERPVALAVGHSAQGNCDFVCAGVRDLATGELVGARTQFRVASISKVVATVLVVRLSQAGLIDLEAPANDYLRSCRLVGDGADATVRELLTHTAGIGLIRGIRDLSMSRTFGPRSDVKPVVDPATYYAPKLRIAGTAGVVWSYSNHAHSIAAQIAADLLGTPFHVLVEREVTAPLGMTESGYYRADNLAKGYNQRRDGEYRESPQRRFVAAPAGEFVTTVEDLLRLAAALSSRDDPFLDDTHREMMSSPQTLRSGERIPFASLGFRLRHLGSQIVAVHGGRFCGYSSFLIVDFEHERATVTLSTGIKLSQARAIAEDAFAGAHVGQRSSKPTQPTLAPATGVYRLRRAGFLPNLHGLVSTGGYLKVSEGNASFGITSPIGMFAGGATAFGYGAIAGRYLYVRPGRRPDELQVVVDKHGRESIWMLPALLIFDRSDDAPPLQVGFLFGAHRCRRWLRRQMARVRVRR